LQSFGDQHQATQAHMEIADECLIQCKGNYFHAYYGMEIVPFA